jgi:GWxTD domain-containing protein
MRRFEASSLKLQFSIGGGTVKKAWIAVAALVFTAAVASAQMTKYKDWAKSPEAYFLTTAERTEWAAVTTDADAEKFIATYYAKRGGDKFKDEIERRIAAADTQFKLRRQRGAETARARLLIVLGGPTKVSSSRAADGGSTGDSGLNVRPDSGGFNSGPGVVTQTWTYGHEKFDPSWGVPELVARVTVDAQRGTDEFQNRVEVERVLAVAAEKSVVNPAAQPAAPASAGAVKPAVPPAATGPATAPAAVAPPAPAVASIPPATRALLDSLGSKGETTGFWGGPFHSIPGDPFFSLELATSADKVPGNTARFAGVVTSDSGQEVASYWDEVPMMDAKTGSRTEKIYERSIVLPPGSYKGTFALVSADGSTSLASGAATFRLPAKGTDFEVSPLILASTLSPLTKRPAPTDPFVFGMEKPIRVDPKASRLFSKEESLWYFYTVTNPVLPAPAAAASAPAPSATPGAPGAPAAAPAAAAPEVKPRLMTRLSVLRDGKPAFAPATLAAEVQMLSPGYYATGSEIPLTSFEPGFYTFSINIRDLNAPKDSAANKGVDRTQDFVVLKADGSMPDHAAVAAPAPTPRPKPAKK